MEEEVHSTARIVPLELFKVPSVVTNILMSSGIVQSNLFIWKFIMNRLYELVKDWRIRSICNFFCISSLSFPSSLMSLITIIQCSWTDCPSYIFKLKSFLDTSKHTVRLCLPYNSYRWVIIALIVGVGAKICLRRRSWSRESRGRRRDLQRKSKPEVGLLWQDPPTLKSVLCLNKNGVLERRI